MQNALATTDASSAANPLLDIWLQQQIAATDSSGVTTSLLTDPSALTFSIWALDCDGKTTQVFPDGGGEHAVNLTTDKIPDSAHGHYAAAFSVSGFAPATPPGTHCQIRWLWTMPDGTSGRMVRDFDVLQAVPLDGTRGYCLVSELREEGICRPDANDARLLRLIRLQSDYVDRVTGRFFEPRLITQHLNGSGGRAALFGDPLIALVSVTLGNPVVNTIDVASFRIFNRHITQRLTNPDDRNDPKIEFVHFRDIFGRQRSASVDSPLFGVPFRDLFFPAGVQNVNVTALWGYTEWDGSSVGRTPDLIRHATKLLVAREAARFKDDQRDDRKRYRLTQERSRDQSYSLDAASEGAFTGDREIDDILLMFMRPIAIGAV